MPNLNKTEITMIMDASGSMGGDRQLSALNGYNEFIQEQKKVPGECTVSLVFFNSDTYTSYLSKDIREIGDLTTREYVCDGMTALNDAIGKTINQLGTKLEALDENDRPGKVIICTITDGEENSSKEFTLAKVKEMMDHQTEKYGWQFVLMGAKELNVTEMGHVRGLAATQTMAVNLDSLVDTRASFSTHSKSVSMYRTGQRATMDYSSVVNDVDDKNKYQTT